MPAFYPEGDEPKLADPSGRSLHKINNLLKSIDAKTGSTTITGPVTVSNEVEVTNSTGNPIPVSGTVGLDSTSLAALENISVTFPATQNVNVTNAGLSVSVSNLPSVQPVSIEEAPVTPVTDNGGSLTVDGSVSVSNFPATQPISGTVTVNNQSLTTGSGTLPGTSAVDTDLISSIDVSGFSEIMVQFTGFPFLALAQFQVSNDNSTFVPQAALPLTTALPSPLTNINAAGFYKLALAGARYVRLRIIGAGLSGTWVYSYTLNPRSSSNFGQLVSATALPLPTGASSETTLSAVNTKIPSNLTVSSTRLLVDGSGVTQPTRETQPIGDYVINTSAFANFSPVGSVLTSSAFDAGANADYVVITLEGGGSSGAFSFDLSILNTGLWDPGTGGFFNVYYDIPATSATDTYSYRNVNSPTLFGSTRTAFNGRFIIPLTQNTPYAGTSTTYRYIRLNCPASYGGWRYRFTSYKSVNSLLSASVPGNPSTTRVTGRVDVGYISNLPALPTGTNTIGSVNVLGGNATAVKVDGSAVTQPVSIASAPVTPVTDNGGSLTVDGTVTVNDMTSGNAKTKIVDSTGADVSYIPAGTAGTPSSSVLSVQGISGGTVIGINSSHVGDGIQAYLNDHGNDIPVSGTVSIIDTSSTGTTPTNFSSLTYATISASNASRKGLTIFNEGPGLLYVTLGTSTTTSSSFTVRMSAGDYYEVPFGYIGLVGGIFGTAGNARVTEIT